ncbi:MAG: class I SAM-dependent methyltransferase [Deferrisomatales bacterium]|nr:class I SAM-dependent methyltransferase [Deferrisomatales bacterium]
MKPQPGAPEAVSVNDPSAYYAGEEAPSLLWEMTVCQCLADRDSPYLAALERPRRYGEAVGELLADRLGTRAFGTVVEVGGGTGSLMAAFLEVVEVSDLTMVDLSPRFLGLQEAALCGRPGVRFVVADAVEYLGRSDAPIDLVVSNENIGDLRTYVNLPRDDVLRRAARREHVLAPPDDPVGRAARLVAAYGLEGDVEGAPDTFAFNVGAVEYLEALAPRARAVFLTEHGADTVVPAPYRELAELPPSDGFPRRIALKGHDEYTIRFAHLERVARRLGYAVERFHVMEFLGLRRDPGARSLVRVPNAQCEAAEVFREFYDHVAEYQGLLLTRPGGPGHGG